MKITEEMWKKPYKKYKVPIEGGIFPYYEIEAPCKTIARMLVEGCTHPWIHVKGKIIEVKD